MNSIYFKEEHQIFRDNLRQFLAGRVDVEAWEKAGRIPREIWKEMGELGYLGVTAPESYGGSGGDFFHAAVLLEELGRTTLGGFAAAVGVQQFMATPHILNFGSESLRKKYLKGSVEGDLVGCLAVTEPDAGSDVSTIRTRAEKQGDHYLVNGSKTFITNGVYCDFATVAVRTGSGGQKSDLSLLVIDAATPGFTAAPLKKLGWHCSDTAEIHFENVKVPAANLIGEEGMGFYYLMECFQLERLVAALTSLGSIDACLQRTLDYTGERHAFGRPVSRFQVVRHQLADLMTEWKAAAALTYHTCWLMDQNQHAVLECSMAKLKATELAMKTADRCLQFFGGYGFMEEYPAARMFRDARAGAIVGGSSEIMREIIAKVAIDGVRYESALVRDQQPDPPSRRNAVLTVHEIVHTLPDRFLGDHELKCRIHFNFNQDNEGAYTVVLENGTCQIQEGLNGKADCTVTARGDVYRNIELGRIHPEAAFMGSRVLVDNIPLIMRFLKSFTAFQEQDLQQVIQERDVSKPEEKPRKLDVSEIVGSLPERFRGRVDLDMRVHFNFERDGKGSYTVTLHDGACTVEKGLHGEPTCRVITSGRVYRAIERRKLSVEAAFMGGKIQVNNISSMLTFLKSFKRLGSA